MRTKEGTPITIAHGKAIAAKIRSIATDIDSCLDRIAKDHNLHEFCVEGVLSVEDSVTKLRHFRDRLVVIVHNGVEEESPAAKRRRLKQAEATRRMRARRKAEERSEASAKEVNDALAAAERKIIPADALDHKKRRTKKGS